MANVRKTFCQLAVGKTGYSGAEVARGVAHIFSPICYLVQAIEPTKDHHKNVAIFCATPLVTLGLQLLLSIVWPFPKKRQI